MALLFFFVFIAITLGITYWAARRTRTTEHFYAAGRSISAGQNGFALAGDYMSAASFLGIAGLVSLSGFDGLIYSIGFLVGWPVVMFLIAEPLRNLGKYTFADVVAYRMKQRPEKDADAEAGHDELREERLVVGDEENEAEVEDHHRRGQAKGDSSLRGGEAADGLLPVAHAPFFPCGGRSYSG